MRKKFVNSIIITTLAAAMLVGCGGSGSYATSDEYAGSASNSRVEGFAADAAPMTKSAGIASRSWETNSVKTEAVMTNESAVAGEVAEDYEYDSYNDDVSVETESKVEETENAKNINEESTDLLVESKIIYSADISIETLEYDNTMDSIRALMDKYGAVIQSENESNNADNWYYSDYHKSSGVMRNHISIRVPSKHFREFIDSLDGYGNIRSKNTSADNISQTYYDTSIRITSLQKEEELLLQMMNNSYNIDDMIQVEKRLADVQSELLQLQTNIKYMDMDVAYSYVNLDIREVVEYTPEKEPIKTNTFVDRLVETCKDTWRGFLNFCEGLLFAIIRLLPTIFIFGVIFIIVRLFLWKKIKAYREAKKNGHKGTSELSSLLKYNEDNVEAKGNDTEEK